MKKLLVIAATTAIFALSACSGKKTEQEAPVESTAAAVEQTKEDTASKAKTKATSAKKKSKKKTATN